MVFLNKKRNRRIIIAIASVVLIFFVCAIYLWNYHHADLTAIEAFSPQNTSEMQILEDKGIVFAPKDATKGFIFYPGGKVEYTAYIPLMKALCARGILCVLVEMPFNLAVFDINAADGIQKIYPQIKEWYIGGHSLGGSMAATYISDNANEYKGLVLLGAYSTADISDSGLKALTIYGSEDKVLNHRKYEKNKVNLPSDYSEFIIDGGCHAYFGMYGNQKGDGTPTISNEEQIQITADYISAMIIQG